MFEGSDVSFFLGAPSYKGYVSLFGDAYDPEKPGKYYILKGGPGTGKSTFMARVADAVSKEGFSVERVYCSADPDSLDAVIFPELSSGIFDGTAPHVMDPKYPGVCEEIINLGAFWNSEKLCDHCEEIKELSRENTLLHRRVAEFLRVASLFERENARIISRAVDTEKLDNYVTRLAARAIPERVSPEGTTSYRFLTGITPDGVIVKRDTLRMLAPDTVIIEDEYSVVSEYIVSALHTRAVKKGYDTVLCRCPLFPDEKAEHLIIPSLGFGLFTENTSHRAGELTGRTVHASRFIDDAYSDTARERLRFNSRAKKELMNEAVKKLSMAKAIHNELEKHYIAAMDFEKSAAVCKKVTDLILGNG